MNFLLVFSGRQDSIEAILAALDVLPEPMKSVANVLVDVCAYAGWCVHLKKNILLNSM